MPKDKPVDKDRELLDRLPLIRCECGAEILLLPDLKVMEHAIEVHVDSHRELEKNIRKKTAISTHIRNYLIEQLLKRASEMETHPF